MDVECVVGRGHREIHPFFSDEDPCWNGARHVIAIGLTVEPADKIPLCCRHFNDIVRAYAAFDVERDLCAPEGA